MVSIEQVDSPATGKTSTAAAAAEAAPSGYVSDGYETASDTELNGTENGSNRESENTINMASSSSDGDLLKEKTQEQQPEVNQEQLNEALESDCDELRFCPLPFQLSLLPILGLHWKALAQANDAKVEGNALFKDGLYEEALSKYELALQVAADIPSSTEIRSICHANRAACFTKLGKHEETIKECTKALELNPTYIKALVRRAEAHEKLEHFEEAITDMTKILELEPSHDQARRTVMRLKPLADEKREKMKEEMIGKLKEMGNSILGRFGMSVDNFKTVKDPNTGSYSVQFQK
ncbi:hypothetical protein MTR67_029816 [Solanum verrucosum]|uniref:Tetratricopeptide repeat protein 1 n=1 Tax=Solanum verrucosum TaxID=315347 RepID=A0AAF0RD86_SOLVR|nr:hypothetical protein MTR67_029816 [Solanum verrucosum]